VRVEAKEGRKPGSVEGRLVHHGRKDRKCYYGIADKTKETMEE
jgi:hypothetical protein